MRILRFTDILRQRQTSYNPSTLDTIDVSINLFGTPINGGEGLIAEGEAIAIVPEPSTFFLLGGGLIGLAFAVRRRRKE